MWKMVLAGTTALAIAGGTLAYAQQGPSPRMPHWRPSAQDMAAFADARIAALHAGLKLTADQEKHWPAVESALHDLAKQGAERRAARADADRPKDPLERLSRRADAMQAHGAALKKLAEAAGPLYQSLDDGQKHRLVVLARVLRPHEGRFAARHWDGHRGPRGWHPGAFGPGRGEAPMGPQGSPEPL
jgi:hypothetical protein